MLEMLDSGESMGCCRENMQSQKRIKLERPSGRPKWKAKIGGKRLKSKLDSTGWQRVNLGWKHTLGRHKVRRQSGSGSG